MPLADTQAIAILTGRKPGTIRSWASKGWLTRHGTNGPHGGRALYDVDQARRIADELDNTLTSRQHLEHSRTLVS